MSAVFGTSQQDGCCFVSALRTVNILWQTQLQVARWLALGSWAGLQRPINRDINMESWGMEGREATGVFPTFGDKNTKEKNPGARLEVEAAKQGRMRPHLVPVLPLTRIPCDL